MSNEKIVIVEYSGLFPDADDESIFFKNLLEGHIAIKNLLNPELHSKSDFDLSPHFSMDRTAPDTTYCRWASFLERDNIYKWAFENNLKLDQATLSEMILHKITQRIFLRQARTNLPEKIDLVLGISTVDPTFIKCHQKQAVHNWVGDELLNHPEFSCLKDYYYETKLDKLNLKPHSGQISFRFSLESVRDKYNLGGAVQIVEAACAASLAAMHVGICRLKAGLCDGLLVGSCGLDLNLFMMAGFSKLGVESPEITVPFSKKAEGMNPGEAAALFLVLTESEAKRRNLPIKGVILSCEGSSDGALGGLVEPTEKGQTTVYERAYKSLGTKKIFYLETHGTGTAVGDKTEISSISQFFGDGLIIGGSKANVGHTMCAAGSVSLVKALKIIETKKIPPQPNQDEWMDLKGLKIVEKNPLNIEDKTLDTDLRIGMSSFGFGGSNFHLVLGEAKENKSDLPKIKTFEKIVLVGEHRVNMDLVDDLFKMSGHRIPPITLPHLDKTIIGAIVATEQLFQKLQIRLPEEAREQVGVISTSDSILDVSRKWVEKEALLDVLRRLPPLNDISNKIKLKIQEKLKDYLELTEDSLPGALNNLISGKVTKAFDLRGPNFNLNDERASMGSAIESAVAILKQTGGGYLITSIVESMSTDGSKLNRNEVWVQFITEYEYALKYNLPIQSEIGTITRGRLGYEKRRKYPNDPLSWR